MRRAVGATNNKTGDGKSAGVKRRGPVVRRAPRNKRSLDKHTSSGEYPQNASAKVDIGCGRGGGLPPFFATHFRPLTGVGPGLIEK